MTLLRLNRGPALLAVLAASAAVLLSPQAAHADSNATPTYEVKLDLDASALNSDGTPTSAVLSTFGLSGPAERSYEYLDTSDLRLDAKGWDVRVRHKAGKDIEYTYKRRFPVSNGDVDGALDDANDAGFDSSDDNYDAEVDWGYGNETVSFSDEKDTSGKAYSGTSLPSSATAIKTAADECPGKLDDETNGKGWGASTIKASRVHGPATSTVWSGTWEGQDASLEVLPLKDRTVVELSFKIDDGDTATDVRRDAIDVTDSHGWLQHSDELKTNLVLSEY